MAIYQVLQVPVPFSYSCGVLGDVQALLHDEEDVVPLAEHPQVRLEGLQAVVFGAHA